MRSGHAAILRGGKPSILTSAKIPRQSAKVGYYGSTHKLEFSSANVIGQARREKPAPTSTDAPSASSGPTCSVSSILLSGGEVEVSNGRGKKRRIRMSELDSMSQHLLTENPQGIGYGITCEILSFFLRCAKKLYLPVRHLQLQTERRMEWKESWLYLNYVEGALYSERVKLI